MTPEGKVKKAVKDALRDAGIYYLMPVTGGFGNSGDPDIIACVGGLMVGIETKVDCEAHRRGDLYRGKRIMKNAPTSLQRQRMAEMRASGGVTLVIDSKNVECFVAVCRGLRYTAPEVRGHSFGSHAYLSGLVYDVPPDKKVSE